MTGISALPRRGAVACLLAVALAVALAGCNSSSGGSSSGGGTATGTATTAATTSPTGTSPTGTSPTGTSPTAATAAMITIKNFAFQTPASVSPGAKITVRNEDGTDHTVTADSGNAFDDKAPAGTSTFTAPTTPGSYPFHCTIHPFMKSTLVVK
jgi:plastocyanin